MISVNFETFSELCEVILKKYVQWMSHVRSKVASLTLLWPRATESILNYHSVDTPGKGPFIIHQDNPHK